MRSVDSLRSFVCAIRCPSGLRKVICVASLFICMVLLMDRWTRQRVDNHSFFSGVLRLKLFSPNTSETEDKPVSSEPIKVLLLTYMRSGSTFVGELLHQHENATYWFEPLDGAFQHLYHARPMAFPIDLSHYADGTRRSMLKYEHEFLADQLLSLLNCEYKGVAIETLGLKRKYTDQVAWQTSGVRSCMAHALTSRGLRVQPLQAAVKVCRSHGNEVCDVTNFHLCHTSLAAIHEKKSRQIKMKSTGFEHMENIRKRVECMTQLKSAVDECISSISHYCRGFRARAVKVIRLSMNTVQHILAKDDSVKVVHLLRDPRGIVHSRAKINLLSRLKRAADVSRVVAEARIVCEKMQRDIALRMRLHDQYPGSFIEVRYEDVATNPYDSSGRIFDFLGLQQSARTDAWIKSRSKGAQGKGAHFSTFRNNSTATATRWQTEMNAETIQHINTVCKDVLEYLNVL